MGQQQKNQSSLPMGMHLHSPHPPHQPHPHHHQVPSATVPGPPPRGVGYFPTTNGPPPANLIGSAMVNSQYPNTFLFNCYPGGVANGWAGVPLISTAKRRPPRKSHNANSAYKSIDVKEFASGSSSAMSKLALHAHGAPLILSGGANGLQGGGCGEGVNVSAGIMCGPRHANNMSGRLPMRYRNKSNQNAHRVQQQQFQQLNGGQRVPQSSDTVNRHCDRGFQFNTDENSSIFSTSSGSCSSSTTSTATADSGIMAAEACLPRIIKPRKRRKKERKPGSVGAGDSREEEIDRTEDSQDLSSKTSEEDFEDDEVLVSDFTTSCSCRLCDPHSHIWSFPMGRVCSLEKDSFAVDQQSSISDLYLHTMTRRNGGKDVGVIGGNRQNQQRNEWRGSAQQQQEHQQQFQRHPLVMDDLCDNKLFNGNSESNSLGLEDNNNPHRYVNGEVLFGRWPGAVVDQGGANMNSKCVALSDEESVDSFSCANVFGMGATPVAAGDDLLMLGSDNNDNFCGIRGAAMADEEEELLIENLANLLNVSNGPEETATSHRRHLPTQLPVHCETNSDSSGVSSASDCGSVFGECYSPLVNLGSPPSMAFNFSIKAAALPIGHNGLLAEEQLLAAGHHREVDVEEEQRQQQHHLQQQQHILNCLDMDWYRAATTNRRLLLPYSNN